MDSGMNIYGYEKEIRDRLKEAQNFAANIHRGDKILKTLKRALGDRVETLGIKFSVSGMTDNALKIHVNIKGAADEHGFDWLRTTPMDDEEQEAARLEFNATITLRNIERYEEVIGTLHRYLACKWKISFSSPTWTRFTTTICEDVVLSVDINGPVAEEYKEKKHQPQNLSTMEPVCERGFDEASIGG